MRNERNNSWNENSNCMTRKDSVSEWLRRLTTNQFLSEGVGSNPIGVVLFAAQSSHIRISSLSSSRIVQSEERDKYSKLHMTCAPHMLG
jgi:hypothetical protein